MMNEQLKKDIEAMVAEIFSQKEEAEKKVRTEEALQKAATTITELTEALEAKNAQEVEFAEKIQLLENTISDLTSKLEAAQKEIENSNTKLAESEKVILEMKKDMAADLRMKELVEAGVALSQKEKQMAKIRDMSDEEFASYKEELLTLRKAVEDELAKAAAELEAKLKKEEEDKSKAAANADDNGGNGTVQEAVLPPKIDKDAAMKAALNLEVSQKDDILTKYAEMGKALAQRMVKKNK